MTFRNSFQGQYQQKIGSKILIAIIYAGMTFNTNLRGIMKLKITY